MKGFARIISIVLALCISLLTGCTGSKRADNSIINASKSRQETIVTAGNQAEPNVVLKYWSDNGYESFFKPLIEGFNEIYPNIRIEMNYYAKEVDMN